MFSKLYPLLGVVLTDSGAEKEIKDIMTECDAISAKKLNYSVTDYCKLVVDL